MRLSVEHDEEAQAEDGQDEDAVRVGEPVPTVRELARDEAVPRQERGDPGKVGEARVGRQDEDQSRDGLDQVVKRRLPEDRARELGVRRLARDRHDVGHVDQERDPDEQGDQDHAQRREHLAGVLRLGRPEGRDAVRHRFDPGQGRAARRERAEREEQGQRLHAAGGGAGHHGRREVAAQPPHEAPPDHDEVRADEEVGRPREEAPGFPHAAEIDDRDRDDSGHAQGDPMGIQRRDRGRDRVDPRRSAHRHREHVVDEERRAGHEARVAPQILPGHDVGPATPWVREDRLAEGRDDDRDEHRDRQRDRQGRPERRGAGGDQDQEDRLRRVRHRRQGVRGEDCQARDAAQPLVLVQTGRDRPPDEDALDALDGHRVRRAGAGPGPPLSPRVAAHAGGVRIARAGPLRRDCRIACTPR